MDGFEAYLPLIARIGAGLIGGGLVGALLRGRGLGGVGNLIVGALGGFAAAYVLGATEFMGVGLSDAALIDDAVVGLIGGAALQAVTAIFIR